MGGEVQVRVFVIAPTFQQFQHYVLHGGSEHNLRKIGRYVRDERDMYGYDDVKIIVINSWALSHNQYMFFKLATAKFGSDNIQHVEY
jgi:hypothetical protein